MNTKKLSRHMEVNLHYKKFIDIMSKSGYQYELEKTCDYCMYDPSDGTSYYENCLDCDIVDALLMFNNGIHKIKFEGTFGENISDAKFFQGEPLGWTFRTKDNFPVPETVEIPFSISDIIYIAFLENNLVGFKLSNNKKIEIKDGRFFREKTN